MYKIRRVIVEKLNETEWINVTTPFYLVFIKALNNLWVWDLLEKRCLFLILGNRPKSRSWPGAYSRRWEPAFAPTLAPLQAQFIFHVVETRGKTPGKWRENGCYGKWNIAWAASWSNAILIGLDWKQLCLAV